MQGVAMTVASITRAVGPTMGAELFAWSLTNGLGPPLDIHFVFLLMCLINLLPVAIACSTFTTALDLPMDSDHQPGPEMASPTASAAGSVRSAQTPQADGTEMGSRTGDSSTRHAT